LYRAALTVCRPAGVARAGGRGERGVVLVGEGNRWVWAGVAKDVGRVQRVEEKWVVERVPCADGGIGGGVPLELVAEGRRSGRVGAGVREPLDRQPEQLV